MQGKDNQDNRVRKTVNDLVVANTPTESELGAKPLTAGAVAFATALSSKLRGPFAALAGELVRVPGGRVAFVITPH